MSENISWEQSEKRLEAAVQLVITEIGNLRIDKGVWLGDLSFGGSDIPRVAFTVKDTENNVVEVYETYKPPKGRICDEAYWSRFTLDRERDVTGFSKNTHLHFDVRPLIETKGLKGLYGTEKWALGLQRAIDDGKVTLARDAGDKNLRFDKAA